jgi:para-nitrobenzyl esterase
VRIATGGLRGVDLEGLDVEAFLGIPYGAPATGAGRWAPPRPVSPWTGVRPAADPGPACPQPARPFSEWAHGPLPATDEDSLTVNVWRPAGEGPARPVLVFVHGGGWAIGWGSNALLDGRHLALALDAVVVTLNYRLGSLGWLYHPDLATSSGAPAGNWGLLDQKAALRWVADNIAAFGGDPARVTLAGESAGAGNVLHLLTDPEAAPLFARALTLSPPLHELVVDRALGERWTEALLAHLDLGDDVASGVAVLRELPAATIVATQEKLLAGEAFSGGAARGAAADRNQRR